MARKLVEDAKKIEAEHVDSAKRRLAGSIGHLLAMEQAFDHDTRRLFELVRPYAQAVLADRQNETKFDEFQLFARAFIRALFAHVEGVTHFLRQVVLWAYERGEIGLDASRLSRLREPKPHAKKVSYSHSNNSRNHSGLNLRSTEKAMDGIVSADQ